MKTKYILSVDPSITASAFIYGDTNGNVLNYKFFSDKKTNHKNFHCVPFFKEDKASDKMDVTVREFMKILANKKVDLVVLESPSYGSTNTSDEFKSLYGVLAWFSRQVNMKYVFITPVSNKLFFTGNARAEKQEMVDTAIQRYGKEIDFDTILSKNKEDIADALGLYELGYKFLMSDRLPAPKDAVDTDDIKFFETLPPYQRQVIAKMYNRDDLYKQAIKDRKKLDF